MTGVEPASPAWEAGVLPMNYICVLFSIAQDSEKVIKILLQIAKNDYIIFTINIANCQRRCTQEGVRRLFCLIGEQSDEDLGDQ